MTTAICPTTPITSSGHCSTTVAKFDLWREELRSLLRQARAGTAKPEAAESAPAVITGQAVTVYNTPFEDRDVDGPVTDADFRAVTPFRAENSGNSRKTHFDHGSIAREAPLKGRAVPPGETALPAPRGRKAFVAICAGLVVVLGSYGVKRYMELPARTGDIAIPGIDDQSGTKTITVVRTKPIPPGEAAPSPRPDAAPEANPLPKVRTIRPVLPEPTAAERPADAEKKRQDDIRAAAQKRSLDELEDARLKKQQAAKDLNAKLKTMAKADSDDLCKQKLEGLNVSGFSLKCDTMIPFGALLGNTPVSQTASSLGDCAARCRREAKCVAFSFDAGAHTGSASCYLTGSIPEQRSATNWIAGLRQ